MRATVPRAARGDPRTELTVLEDATDADGGGGMTVLEDATGAEGVGAMTGAAAALFVDAAVRRVTGTEDEVSTAATRILIEDAIGSEEKAVAKGSKDWIAVAGSDGDGTEESGKVSRAGAGDDGSDPELSLEPVSELIDDRGEERVSLSTSMPTMIAE
jgi:hypothetical protein